MAAEMDAQLSVEGAGEDALPEDALPEDALPADALPEDATPSEARGRTKRRATAKPALDKENIVKKPRWGDKAFEEITIADVETLVRKCNSLEKQCAGLAEVSAEVRDIDAIKSAIAKQLLAQMIYVGEWNYELKTTGREICAFIPNVSPQMCKALGGDVNSTAGKRSKNYFDKLPAKSLTLSDKADKENPPGGSTLVLSATMSLKWLKTTSELQVKTSYKFGVCERLEKIASNKAAAGEKKRGRKKNVEDAGGDDAECSDDGDEEEGAAEDAANAEAAGEDDVTAESQGGA